MHDSVMDYTQRWVNTLDLSQKSTLDVGSYDENGSVRKFFTGDYVGVDMREGPNVDIVTMAHSLPWTNATFDVVVCVEMLEHDSQFWRSLEEMGRVLRPGGHLILTTRGNGFPLHAYPDDFFRFMPSVTPFLLDLAGCNTIDAREDPSPGHPGIFGVGHRR